MSVPRRTAGLVVKLFIVIERPDLMFIRLRCIPMLSLCRCLVPRVPLTLYTFIPRRGVVNAKGKGRPALDRSVLVPELIAVLGSQPTRERSHKLGGRLPLLSARPAVTFPVA